LGGSTSWGINDPHDIADERHLRESKMFQRQQQNQTDEVWAVISASRKAFLSTAIFSGVVNILMLTGPLFMLQVYDRVLGSGSVPTLIALSAIVFVIYCYYGFLEFIRARMLVRVGRRVEETLRTRVFNSVTALAMQRANNTGSQPINDLATIRQYLAGPGPLAFLDMPWVPVYMLIVFLLHWQLGVASLFAAATIFGIAVASELATRTPLAKANAATTKSALMTEEARRNAEALFSLGMRGTLRDRWNQVQQVALDEQTRANDAGGGLSAASRVVRLMVQSGMLALGAYLAILQEISPGTIIAGSIIMSRALAPIEQAVASWQQFLGFRKSYERLTRTLQAVPAEQPKTPLPKPKGILEVENLIVQLPGTDKPTLLGLTFKVEAGTGVGVIGPTGAGKSTLAKTLISVLPATKGTIRLDGATLDQRPIDELGRHIGYLPQDVQLFNGSAAENISRFDANPKAEDIVNAAKMANIHDLIMRLPQGYDTQLGDNGSRLSAGQRQRLALARALYGDPVLLILDEPNSNLDAEGEAALVSALKQSLERGAAAVVIAHRPSALAVIDNILVLTDGKQAAFGPRDEILKKVMGRPQGQPQQQQPPQLQANQPQLIARS
jgi:ATP-binding cassette subfamily C protein